jgi:long-chain fatty acid transport protein
MKRTNAIFFMITVFLWFSTFSTGLFAQIDNLTNMSAEWIRMCNRNAATDTADIVIYNPAGLTRLTDGFHLNLSNQTLIREPEHSFDLGLGLGSETYGQDSPDPFLPNFYAAYKKDKWVVFGGVYIPGGGAVVDYPQGSISTKLMGLSLLPVFAGVYDYFKDDALKASSLYLTTTLGAAYAISDTVSLAAGVRYIKAKNTMKVDITMMDTSGVIPDTALGVDFKDTADGFGLVLGLNISPSPKLNIGIRYESKVKLEFETDVIEDSFNGLFVTDGAKRRRDFPGMLGMGMSYQISSKVRTELDFNYFFQKQADWGTVLTLTGEKEYSELAGNCWSLGAALIYQAGSRLQLSGGFIYTKFDFQDMDTYYTNTGAFEVLYSDNLNLGLGFSYEILESVKLNLGFSTTLWKDETIKALAAFPLDVDVQTDNAGYCLAVGLDISF